RARTPIGVRDLPCLSGPPTRVEPTYRRGGVRGRHVSRRRRRGRESSAGRLAHPPHSMRVVEACSAAAARGAAFVRPDCRPHITEVYSAAACATSAQSPSVALNGYDCTALFHHAAYAASYTARSATWQATPLATPGAVSTRQHLDMLNGGFQEQARKSRREISFACDAIMYEQYVILYYIVGPTCREPNSCVRTPLRYKREALAVHRTDMDRSRRTQALTTFSLSWEGNTTHSGRRVLRSGGPNHSKSCGVHRVLG